MRIIDRYVMREVMWPFVIGLLVFTFMLIIPFLIEYAETFISKGVAIPVVLRIMATLLPQALALTIPMSLLLGLLVAFGRLSADREFVAMQACGVSLLRLLRPVGLISIMGWMVTTYVLIWGVPAANQSFRQQVFEIAAQRAEGEVKPRVFFDQFRDLVLYVREVPPAGNVWNGIFVADLRPNFGAPIFLAGTGHVSIDRDKRRIDMVLQNGSSHSISRAGHYDTQNFTEHIISVDPTVAFLNGDL